MDSTEMLDANQPIVLGDMRVEFEIDGQRVSARARVVEQLSPARRVVFEVSDVPREPQWSRESVPGDPSKEIVSGSPFAEGPSRLTLENGTEVGVVPSSWLFTQTEATLYLSESPGVVLQWNGPITQVQFGVLNVSHRVLHSRIVLRAFPWSLAVEPVSNLRALEKTLSASSGYAITHWGIVEREDGQSFSEKDAVLLLDCVEKFLSFVCGSSCAVTQVVGKVANGGEGWKRWGSRHAAAWKRHRSWADETIGGALSGIFESFWQDYSASKSDLDRVLGWYVYSNEADAADVSIILNQAVLEFLISLTAGPRNAKTGVWMANGLKNKGIDPAIPSYCVELTAFASQHKLTHGPHALVAIRNSMVHSNATVQPSSIDVYHEAKQLGLWYTELLLFRRFNYSGEYASRLVPVQRSGATELVPWARGATKLKPR